MHWDDTHNNDLHHNKLSPYSQSTLNIFIDTCWWHYLQKKLNWVHYVSLHRTVSYLINRNQGKVWRVLIWLCQDVIGRSWHRSFEWFACLKYYFLGLLRDTTHCLCRKISVRKGQKRASQTNQGDNYLDRCSEQIDWSLNLEKLHAKSTW